MSAGREGLAHDPPPAAPHPSPWGIPLATSVPLVCGGGIFGHKSSYRSQHPKLLRAQLPCHPLEEPSQPRALSSPRKKAESPPG